jgi:hypothetical protein
MSKILLYQEATTGVTTNGEQHAFFINENGIPTIKNGSQVITFSTSGSAFTGSSGSSGANGSAGVNGTAGSSGVNGADGAAGSSGSSGATGSSGSSGANGLDGAVGADGATGSSGTSGQTYGTSGSSGATGSSGSSGAPGAAGSSGTSGQEGLASYTVTTTANITKTSGNIFTKTSGGDSWNSGFYSLQGFRSAYVGGTPLSTTGLALIGMSSGSITTNDPTFIDYGMGVYSGSTNIVVIESGTVVYTHGSAPTSTTRYLINYDIQNVRYYIDGTLVHTTSRSELGTLFMDVAVYTQGAGFSNVSFGASGPVGPAGASGTSGTSAGGGITDLVNPLIKNAALDKTQTIAGSYSYLHGFFGNASHWGTDSNRNYEFGHTYPVVIPSGDTIDYVYFPINLDVADTNITFKIVVWSRKAGTYYPQNKLSEDTFTYSGATTGYKMLAYNLDYTNTGNTENHFFISVVGYDSTGTVYRFRQSVVQYNYDSTYGLIDLSNGDIPANYLHGVTIVFNSSWVSAVPSTYGTGESGNIQFTTPFIPFFYNIVNN